MVKEITQTYHIKLCKTNQEKIQEIKGLELGRRWSITYGRMGPNHQGPKKNTMQLGACHLITCIAE